MHECEVSIHAVFVAAYDCLTQRWCDLPLIISDVILRKMNDDSARSYMLSLRSRPKVMEQGPTIPQTSKIDGEGTTKYSIHTQIVDNVRCSAKPF